jgi:pyrroloquinoline quinone biosynthesis protein B
VRIRVLGAAAGGGFPQWNCGCTNCQLARSGSSRVAARTEDSIAVSADGASWFLFNAAPSIHAQIAAFAGLWPDASVGTPRRSPIAGIVLTNGDLDHCLGLFSLRESTPLVVYATDRVFRTLVERNAIARTLQRFEGQLTHQRLQIGVEVPLTLASGSPSGLSIVPRATAGKLPIHLDGAVSPDVEDSIGLWVREANNPRVAAYVSAAASLDGLRPALDEASVVFFDGTFWSDDELIARGLGTSRARDMAHLPIGGEGGSLAALRDLPASRKIFVHINNTNPILDNESLERTAVRDAGWEVAVDGLEVTL